MIIFNLFGLTNIFKNDCFLDAIIIFYNKYFILKKFLIFFQIAIPLILIFSSN